MVPSFRVDPTKLNDKRFKIKKLQYNTYELDHPRVKGQLRLLSIPTNILEVPRDIAQPTSKPEPAFLIGAQTIVSFTSQNEKSSVRIASPTDIESAKRIDITNFIIDSPYEPWNEYVLQGTPPLVVRTRTILSKLEWLDGFTDQIGGPSLWAEHNTTQSVSQIGTGEAGMA